MTTSTFEHSSDLVDYWAEPLNISEPKYTQLSIFDNPGSNYDNKKQTYFAIVDPLIAGLFVYYCIKNDLFKPELIEEFDDNTILKYCLQKGHPLNIQLQLTLGFCLETSTKVFKSLYDHLKKQNINFGDVELSEAHRYAISMADVYQIESPDFKVINEVCEKVNITRKDSNIIFCEDEYLDLVDMVNYQSLTSTQSIAVPVTKNTQDDILTMSIFNNGKYHFGTYLTGVMLLLVINYFKVNRHFPTQEEFKLFLNKTLVEQT
jgi:hypothetical protein